MSLVTLDYSTGILKRADLGAERKYSVRKNPYCQGISLNVITALSTNVVKEFSRSSHDNSRPVTS